MTRREDPRAWRWSNQPPEPKPVERIDLEFLRGLVRGALGSQTPIKEFNPSIRRVMPAATDQDIGDAIRFVLAEAEARNADGSPRTTTVHVGERMARELRRSSYPESHGRGPPTIPICGGWRFVR